MSPTTDISIINAFKLEAREKGVTQVTIGQVAKRCACARQTVYYHFGGEMDLIRWILLNECSDHCYSDQEMTSWKNEMYRLLCTLRENSWLFTDLSKSRLQYEFYDILKEILCTRVIQKFMLSCPAQGTAKNRQYVANTLMYSMLGNMLEWIHNGFNETSEEVMDDINRMCGSSLYEMISNFLTMRPSE